AEINFYSVHYHLSFTTDVSVAGSSIAAPIPCSVSPCMYDSTAQYQHSQDALQPHHSGAEVRDMVSSLPPINTVFMGSTGGPP
ncbi:DNA-binding protein RFX6, partial [Tachysurus ichikawai]